MILKKQRHRQVVQVVGHDFVRDLLDVQLLATLGNAHWIPIVRVAPIAAHRASPFADRSISGFGREKKRKCHQEPQENQFHVRKSFELKDERCGLWIGLPMARREVARGISFER